MNAIRSLSVSLVGALLAVSSWAAPSLQIEVAAVRLKFFAEINAGYQLQYSTQLPHWTNLTEVLGTGQITNILDWTDGSRRFYRVTELYNLNQGLVACYPFNGNAQDTSTNGNHATSHGATLVNNRFGRPTSAYQLNGSNQYLSAPSQAYLNLTSNFTISVWATLSSSVNPAILIGKDNGGGNLPKWMFVVAGVPNQEPGNRLHFHINPPPKWYATPLWSPVLNQWHHYVVSKENSTYSFYIDGQFISNTTDATPLSSAITARLTMGQAEGGGWLGGRIDDVRIYNRALALAEILALNGLVE